jgi:hypothetical protein
VNFDFRVLDWCCRGDGDGGSDGVRHRASV